MDRALFWTTVLSLAGLGAMAAVATVLEPPRIPLAEIGDHLGSAVIVDADVRQVRPSPAFTRLVLADGNASAEAVGAPDAAVSSGDLVRVRGTPEKFAGKIQLRLDDAGGLQLIRPWREHHVSLAQILAEPWVFRGTHFVTSGTLRVVSSTPRLEDPATHGSLPILGTAAATVPAGRYVLLETVLEYDAGTGRFLLRAERATPVDAPGEA